MKKQSEKNANKAFSEVIESSLHGFTAQCWQWDNFPAFGQLVTVAAGNRTLFGVVHQVLTGSMDPVRYPFPYQKTEEELLAEQPQIFEFLKTTFQCVIVGYQEGAGILYLVAPEPAKIHTFVCPATPEQCRRFFNRQDYVHLLFGATALQGVDELLLALMKHQATLGLVNDTMLNEFVENFSLLTGNDYRRLKVFLQRMASLGSF